MNSNFKDSNSRDKNNVASVKFNKDLKLQTGTKIDQISRQQAISNIMLYSRKNNNLIEKYNQDFFINYFDYQTIQELIQTTPCNQQMKMQEFVKKLATFISHKQDQTLFLVISLINIHKKIKQETKNESTIKISDFTSYLCQKISNQGAQLLIPLKEIPGQKIKPDPFKIRSIDLQPPVIISQIQKHIPQISKEKQKKDKKIDPLKPLSQFFISPSSNLIITLGSLSSIINIYNFQLEKQKQLFPHCLKVLDKKLAILCFAFSEKQKRIGAIINNIGIAFWDFSDQFRTQKLIQRSNTGTKIYYLQLFDEWVTTETQSILYWDIKQEKVKCKIQQQNSKSINDLCEISHIRALGVGYTMKDESKWVTIYQASKKQQNWIGKYSKKMQKKSIEEIQFKKLARINLSPSGCHTIYYNRFTQIIIPLGYKNTVPLYSIDSQSLDISLIHELKGHQSIVTSITQIDESDIIFTSDDRGNVIVWTLTDMRCQQLIKIANSISSIKCIGDMLFYGDSRINLIKLQGMKIKVEDKNCKSLIKTEQFYAIFKSYKTQRNQVYVFTRKGCRILSMLNGKTLKIVELCSQDQDILIVENYLNGFLIGNSKGDIISYSSDFQLRWKLASVHLSDIMNLKVDSINKFFLSYGRDSNIYVWSQKTLQDQGPRKCLINQQQTFKQQINLTEFSQRYGFFITCSFSKELRIWDYQSCKLCHILQFSYQECSHAVGIKICQYKPLIVVACSNQMILLYKFSRRQNVFNFKLIGKVNIRLIACNQTLRNEKRKNTNLNLNRGVSIAQSHQCQDQIQEYQKINFPLSNTEHLIDKKNDQMQKPQNNYQIYLNSPVNYLVEQIIIVSRGNQYKLIFSYGKGYIMHIDISFLIDQNFSQHSEEDFKKSANVQRPIKQNISKQIYKSQVDRTKFDKKRFNFIYSFDQNKIVWHLKIHKDSITHLDIFQYEYISTLCFDGYYKLILFYTGSTICSININFPLPIKWDYRPRKNIQFDQKIHQAIILVNKIFNDQSNITKTQFESLNLKPFLDAMCRPRNRLLKQNSLKYKNQSIFLKNDKLSKKNQKIQFVVKNVSKQKQIVQIMNKKLSESFRIQILSDEFGPEDIKKNQYNNGSLKSYQVYKRVKKFINVRDSQVQFTSNNKSDELNRKKTQIQQRESIIELLSPNYLPKLLNKDLINTATQKLVLSQNYNNKRQFSLTKEDFKDMYNSVNVSFVKSMSSPIKEKLSVFRMPIQKHNSRGQKQNINNQKKQKSRNKIILDKLPLVMEKVSDQIVQKKMKSIDFQVGGNRSNQNKSLCSLNRSELQVGMNLTSSCIKASKSNLISELCLKTQQFKKSHKITKV